MSSIIEFNEVACGMPPIVIDAQENPEKLRFDLMRAKKNGAIALVIQIVSTKHIGEIIRPQTLLMLVEICKDIHLPLAVDETLTALRCGAPFACQRAEYSSFFKPDLVIFGKALKVSGIGANFEGQMFSSFKIASSLDRLRAIFRWHDVHTRAIPIPSLIEALCVIDTAKMENWPSRSIEVGGAIREAILEHERTKSLHIQEQKPIAGFEALIFVERSRVEDLLLQGTPEGEYLRLLPILDEMMVSEDFLKQFVMGRGSWKARKRVSNAMKRQKRVPLWCLQELLQASHRLKLLIL